MGINGLHAALAAAQENSDLMALSGRCLAVDGHALLHRGACACAADLAEGRPTSAYADFVVRRLKLLAYYRVRTICVFDGAANPLKAATAKKRGADRAAALEAARKLAAATPGKATDARKEVHSAYVSTIRITPAMVELTLRCIEAAKGDTVVPLFDACEALVAPYEADPQLAALVQMGKADGVLTEDSDIAVYLLGSCRAEGAVLVTKLDGHGNCRVLRCDAETLGRPPLSLAAFSGSGGARRFVQAAVLAGCDYVKNVHGVGFIKATALVAQFADVDAEDRIARVADALRKRKPPKKKAAAAGTDGAAAAGSDGAAAGAVIPGAVVASAVPENYEAAANEAQRAFFHARVWDADRNCVRLSDLVEASDDDFVARSAAGDDEAFGPPLDYAATERDRRAAYDVAHPSLPAAAQQPPRPASSSKPRRKPERGKVGLNPFEIASRRKSAQLPSQQQPWQQQQQPNKGSSSLMVIELDHDAATQAQGGSSTELQPNEDSPEASSPTVIELDADAATSAQGGSLEQPEEGSPEACSPTAIELDADASAASEQGGSSMELRQPDEGSREAASPTVIKLNFDAAASAQGGTLEQPEEDSSEASSPMVIELDADAAPLEQCGSSAQLNEDLRGASSPTTVVLDDVDAASCRGGVMKRPLHDGFIDAEAIDLATLAELPADIRADIERRMRLAEAVRRPRPGDTARAVLSPSSRASTNGNVPRTAPKTARKKAKRSSTMSSSSGCATPKQRGIQSFFTKPVDRAP